MVHISSQMSPNAVYGAGASCVDSLFLVSEERKKQGDMSSKSSVDYFDETIESPRTRRMEGLGQWPRYRQCESSS